MKDSIIQIIQAPANLFVVSQEEQEGMHCSIDVAQERVLCLALIEYEDGYREVVPMIADGDGEMIMQAGCMKNKYIDFR